MGISLHDSMLSFCMERSLHVRAVDMGRDVGRSLHVLAGDSPLVAEALVMKEAIDLVMQCEWRQVCFISDSQTIIDAINAISSELSWKIYASIQRIRNLVNVFSNSKFKAICIYKSYCKCSFVGKFQLKIPS